MFFIYSIVYAAVIVILFVPQYLARPKELRRKWLKEKLGYFPKTDSSLWIHAVSVGEVGASVPLLKKLREEYPDFQIIFSTVTDTGQEVASAKVPCGTSVVYLPFDIGFVLRRCLRRVNPKIFITIETELWPNMFRIFGDRGVPVLILNGRISEKSSKGYEKISFFMKKVLDNVKIFGMQSQTDADRVIRIGADPQKVMILGNFKFDGDIPGGVPSWALAIKGPVIVAGSTHSGEEEIVIEAYRENLERFPGLKLLLAPRHPARFREVADLLRTKGIPFVKRSELCARPDEVKEKTEQGTFNRHVILLDSVGELPSVYGIADIAIVGKSFMGHGGQNPLEPAFWGKPILCGPHMENFPFIREFYREGAAFEVEPSRLAKKIREILVSPEKAEFAGKKGKELYQRNSGAVQRAMEIVKEFV